MSDAHQSPYVTIAQAADLLGVHHHTVRRRIADGLLLGYRVAGSPLIRVRRADVEAMLSPIPSAGRSEAA